MNENYTSMTKNVCLTKNDMLPVSLVHELVSFFLSFLCLPPFAGLEYIWNDVKHWAPEQLAEMKRENAWSLQVITHQHGSFLHSCFMGCIKLSNFFFLENLHRWLGLRRTIHWDLKCTNIVKENYRAQQTFLTLSANIHTGVFRLGNSILVLKPSLLIS